ncbi:MAG: hypothetical protein RR346_00725 [Bacteroidales bacterium]
MKNLFRLVPAILLGLFVFSSCSEETKEIRSNDPIEVSFNLNMSDIMSRPVETPDDDNTQLVCPDPDQWYNGEYQAAITIRLFDDPEKEETFLVDLIKRNDGKVVTENLLLVNPGEGKHTLQKILIIKKGEPENVIFATVHHSSKYNSHVEEEFWMPMDLEFGENIGSFEKMVIPISLLCAMYDEAPDFGFAIWGLNFVKVTCLHYIVDIPEDFCNRNSQDIVGDSELELCKKVLNNKQEEIQLVHTGFSTAGKPGEFCFNDQGSILDENEIYILKLYIPSKANAQVIISDTISLPQMYDYKCSGLWETPLGNPTTDGVIHFDLYNTDLTQVGPVNPVNAGCNNPWTPTVIKAAECDER